MRTKPPIIYLVFLSPKSWDATTLPRLVYYHCVYQHQDVCRANRLISIYNVKDPFPLPYLGTGSESGATSEF